MLSQPANGKQNYVEGSVVHKYWVKHVRKITYCQMTNKRKHQPAQAIFGSFPVTSRRHHHKFPNVSNPYSINCSCLILGFCPICRSLVIFYPRKEAPESRSMLDQRYRLEMLVFNFFCLPIGTPKITCDHHFISRRYIESAQKLKHTNPLIIDGVYPHISPKH